MSGIIRISDKFFNIRSKLVIGPADVKTHSSLVKRKNGKWLMLDSVTMENTVKLEVDNITRNGQDLEAVLNLHPFHTMSCDWVRKAYPKAKLYGTKRHHDKLPNLPWEAGLIEDPQTQALFKDDLEFRVPKGVDFISSNENIHFSSVVAFHPDSSTLHVDDTFMFIPTPKVAELLFFKQGTIQLHPTLVGALQSRKGAAEDLRAWVRGVAKDWPITNFCAAHLGTLLGKDNTGQSISKRIEAALTLAEPILKTHELRFGK